MMTDIVFQQLISNQSKIQRNTIVNGRQKVSRQRTFPVNETVRIFTNPRSRISGMIDTSNSIQKRNLDIDERNH